MSYLGSIAKVYFPGVLSILNSTMFGHIKVQPNFYLCLYQNIVGWIVLSVTFIVAAKVAQQKRLRIIDFFSTVALSRYPYLIVVVIITVIRVANPKFLEMDLTKGIPLHPSAMMILFSFFVIVFAIWQITTYFFALKESAGLSGKKLWISFIVSIIVADVIVSPLTMMFL